MKFKEFIERREIEAENEELLWEMSNVRTRESGLPVIIYISTGYSGGKRINHSARLKVSRNYSE